MSGAAACVYEYLKNLRGESFGIVGSVLHGATKSELIDASSPAVVTTGINWTVEPSHLLFNSGAHELLIPLEHVVAVVRSIGGETVELIVRFPPEP